MLLILILVALHNVLTAKCNKVDLRDMEKEENVLPIYNSGRELSIITGLRKMC